MTGQGGWPLNVFLTPEQLPFYGGTYFPPEPRHGMPAWTQVLQAIAEAWSERREEIRAGGERLRERLSGGALLAPASEPLREDALDEAVAGLRAAFDARNGGFGSRAPKFPHASAIELLLRAPAHGAPGERSEPGIASGRRANDMALQTLRAMAAGGIYDQLGGGFARYSVDASWTVPHFEKMLYDNALLARAYLHGWQASGEPRLAEVCRETLDWALREMRGPEGGFYARWTPTRRASRAATTCGRSRSCARHSARARSRSATGTVTRMDGHGCRCRRGRGDRLVRATEQGNFADPHHPEPGLNVLQAAGPTRTDRSQSSASGIRSARLLGQRARAERTRAGRGLDDKRLTCWNALMIGALADAGAALRGAPLSRRGRRLRRVHPARPARRRRPTAAHLQRRPGPDRRLPGGSRVPAGGADRAVRSHLRGALVHRGDDTRRHADRPLRRPRARRLLSRPPPTPANR